MKMIESQEINVPLLTFKLLKLLISFNIFLSKFLTINV